MIFSFGEHELDEERFELRRGGRLVALQPKPLELLFHLVRHRERVVAKQEILDALWPDTVVTDASLARAVSLARLALGDRGDEPALIVTISRRGYRFQAPVREVARRSSSLLARADSEDDPASHYVGRRELVTRLEGLLDAALRGAGRILFLAGEAGIGKTRTAEILAERARLAGAEVATAWGLEEDDPIHWTWTRVLRVVARALPGAVAALTVVQRRDLARLVPELRDADAALASTRGDESVRFRLFEAVLIFLTRAARDRPIALFLDDLHAADAESLWLLEFIGHTIGSFPIAIVVTCREDDAGRAPLRARALERLLRLASLERWSLAGLRGEEVRDFVRARLQRDPDLELLEPLERKTGGNPLLLGESLRSLEARGLLGERRESSAWDALLPEGIQHLLRPKLRCLTPGAREALGCAAAIGVELERGLLARCVLDDADLDARLRELEDAALLFSTTSAAGRLRFAHALVREALYADLVPSGDARRALHARIAAELEKRATVSDDALADRANHACEAAPLVDPSRAAALAQAAGEHAARLHQFERAATWYQRALAVLELGGAVEPATRAALYLGLGAAQTHAVGLERSRAAYRLAAHHARTVGCGDLLASAALGFAHRPSSLGHGDAEVIELLDEAARAVPAAHEALRIRLLSRLAAELRYAEPSRAETLVDEAIAAARRLPDAAVLAHTLNDSSYVRWSPADTHGWIALNGEVARAAHAANDLELVVWGQKGRATGFLELGDVAAVDREIRDCERTAEALRTPLARWLCAVLRAMRALLDADLDAAERHVVESLVVGERVDSAEVALELYVQLFYLRFEQGRAGETESAVRAQVQRFPDAPVWRAGLARILMATGRTGEAGQELDRLARLRFADVPRDRGWLSTLAFAAEVANAAGDASAAEALEPLLAPYAHLAVVVGSGLIYYGPVPHHLGLLAATRSRWDAAIAHFDAALAAEATAGALLWETRTRVACARALLGRDTQGDRPRAAKLLARALATARSHALAELSAEALLLESALRTKRGVLRGRTSIRSC